MTTCTTTIMASVTPSKKPMIWSALSRSLISVRATDPVCLEPGKGSVRVERWQARDIALQVDLDEPATALVRQYYYPGWRARIDPDTPLAVEPSGPTGLLKLALPAGRYRLTLELAPQGPEIAGRILSGAGLLLLGLRGLIGRYGRRRGAPAP